MELVTIELIALDAGAIKQSVYIPVLLAELIQINAMCMHILTHYLVANKGYITTPLSSQ